MKTVPYSRQWITKDDITEVIKVLSSDFITQGPKIAEFEKALAKKIGVKFAVVLNSGTSALHAAYYAAGLTKEDEMITSPITFAATSNAALYLGAVPVFADVEKYTGLIDSSKIEKKLTKKTKLITPVHYSGYPTDLEEISRLAKKYKLVVIEDAAQALGAIYKNYKIGSCRFSDLTVLSFHPVKHITTGEGGAVTTNNKTFYEKILAFRTHGIAKDKKMHYLGYNYRMTDIQAALGLSQLKKLDMFVKRRREIAKIYNKHFKNNSYFGTLNEDEERLSSYHLYPIRLKDKYGHKKQKILSNMKKNGLGVQVHHIPTYLHPYYQNVGYKRGLCPNAEDFYQREISIPIYSKMTNKDVEYVIKIIFKVFKNV